MASWGEQTYHLIFCSKQKWDEGYPISTNGVSNESGWWETLMRFIRLLWRALVSSPEDFENAIGRQFKQLAEDLSKEDINTWLFEVEHFKYRDNLNISENEFYQTLYKTIHIVQRLNAQNERLEVGEEALIKLRENLFNSKTIHSMREKRGIESLIHDPKSHFNKVKQIETNDGLINITNQFSLDFHRCDIFIDGVLSYGRQRQKKSLQDLVTELTNKDYCIEEVEKLLRFCSQTSQVNASKLAFCHINLATALKIKQNEVEYYIYTGENKHFFSCQYGVNATYPDKETRLIATTFFNFGETFDTGNITYRLSKIPFF